LSQSTRTLIIHGMHCAGCEAIIQNAVRQLPGIDTVHADYTGDSVKVSYDDDFISKDAIIACIESKGYQVERETSSNSSSPIVRTSSESRSTHSLRRLLKQIASVALALLGMAFILWLDSWFMSHSDMPKLGSNISYGLLILIGFLTSFHCVGMCGPLILGYTAKDSTSGYKTYASHILYGIGKTLSYTLIGGLFGAFGSVIAFTPHTQGAVGVAAGLFLILFGLHMLEVFSALRHFQLKMPAFLIRFLGKESRKHNNPFIIGLLNGLMIICGPLQAMYVMAAGTENWFQGASTLFFFGIGTLPLLMVFGFLTSFLSTSLAPKLLKASGYIVMVLGAIMLNRGLAISGTGVDVNTLVARVSQQLAPSSAESPSCDVIQTIHMDVLKASFSPNEFTLRKGVPVKWAINGKELNECNKTIVVPQYKLKIELHPGEQTINFTPSESGVVPWSCWMGMIPGTFIVIEDPPATSNSKTANQQGAVPENKEPETIQDRWIGKFKSYWQKLVTALMARS